MKKKIAVTIIKILYKLGFNPPKLYEKIASLFVKLAVSQQGLENFVVRLRKIEPDISNQDTSGKITFNDYWELKRRALQSFQCSIMLRALEG